MYQRGHTPQAEPPSQQQQLQTPVKEPPLQQVLPESNIQTEIVPPFVVEDPKQVLKQL